MGAVTWCSGVSGCQGPISAANSLVGSAANDLVSISAGVDLGVVALSDGDYVVFSSYWDGVAADVGAATWCSGVGGCTGPITSANSLVGSQAGDRVGYQSYQSIVGLEDGDYVVRSPFWDGAAADVGAVTWCSGASGCTGTVSDANSLVGSSASDEISYWGVAELSDGNFIVASCEWDGAAANVGAVTWCSGAGGCTGTVSSANSLVGSSLNDSVGYYGLFPLSGGAYVVGSQNYDGGAIDTGAATFCSGLGGCTGVVSSANSLVGSSAHSQMSMAVLVLADGDYVIVGENYNGMLIGAATWCSGTAGCTGVVSAGNSLTGGVSAEGAAALSDGSYVVGGPLGATWCSGDGACNGAVASSANTLLVDHVSQQRITVLSGGNYLVNSPEWGPNSEGAVTWCPAGGGCNGKTVSGANSLVGSYEFDYLGWTPGAELPDGNYLVFTGSWGEEDQGAVSLGDGLLGSAGLLSLSNSVFGNSSSQGDFMPYAYDALRHRLAVGRCLDNTVTLFTFQVHRLYLPAVRR